MQTKRREVKERSDQIGDSCKQDMCRRVTLTENPHHRCTIGVYYRGDECSTYLVSEIARNVLVNAVSTFITVDRPGAQDV